MTDRHPRPAPRTAHDLMREPPVLIRPGTPVAEAAGLLDAAGVEAAPVIDTDGRCVGVFSAADYRRWAARPRGPAEVVCDWQIVPAARAPDEVRYHMTRRYPVATPAAGLSELLHRLDATPDQFVVVLDRQQRPQGLVFAVDLLKAESAGRRPRRELVRAG